MENYQNTCFISKIVKALSLKKKSKLFTLEKKFAGNKNQDDNRCLCPKYSRCYSSGFSTKNSDLEKNGFLDRFFIEDTMENFIVKSAFGFIGGILLTYICFMFLVFSLNFTLKRATYICIGLGIILSLGLAFSVKIRCTVFLCIPQLFSKRGRQALLAYAFILALSGPAKNTLHNVEVMSESLACGQEQLKQAENEVLKCVQKPNAAARKSIEKLLEKINSAVQYFKNFIFQLYRNSFDILETVLHAQKWLYSISLLCRKKTCSPTQRCLNFLNNSIINCEGIRFFENMHSLCLVEPCVKKCICFTNTNTFCHKCDVAASFPVTQLKKHLVGFKNRSTNIYSVKIEAHQTYSQYNRTNIYHEEYQGMATEIRQKTDQFLQYFDFMSVIFGIFILVLFVKVIIYRHKFLTEDQYDNRFITSDFVDIDNARAEFQMETLLPLCQREKMKYIKVTSCRLVPCEKVRLLSSFVFLIFATFKIIIHMLTDSSLYWILSSVRHNERLLYMSTIRVENPSISVKIIGSGLVADFIRNVTSVVEEHSNTSPLDPTPCLPDPVRPDWNRYYQILALVLICWLLALCEPYGLRLRHSVMVTYHPDRARERAIWLYNKILSNRMCFVKVARKELRKKYKDVPEDVVCSFQFLSMQSSFKCLLCNVKLTAKGNHFKCQTFRCVGMFCSPCFESLKFCSICHYWGDSGETSDLSEERDSSDEDICHCSKPKPKKPAPCSTPSYKSFSLELKRFRFKLRDEIYQKRQKEEKLPVSLEQKDKSKPKRIPRFENEPASPVRKPKSPPQPKPEILNPPLPKPKTLNPPKSKPETLNPPLPKPKTLNPPKSKPETLNPPLPISKTLNPPKSKPETLNPPQSKPETLNPPTPKPKSPNPSKPSTNTFQVAPVQFEIFRMQENSLNITQLESSDWERSDSSESISSFYRCSSHSLEMPAVSQEKKQTIEEKNSELEVSDPMPYKESQTSIRLSPKISIWDAKSAEEEEKEEEIGRIQLNQKKHLRWTNPLTRYLPEDEEDEENETPKPDFRFKTNQAPEEDNARRISQSSPLRYKSSIINLTLKGDKKKKDLEEKKDKNFFEVEEGEYLEKKKEVLAGFWVVNNNNQQNSVFKAISYGLTPSHSNCSVLEEPCDLGPSTSSHSTHRSAVFPFIDPLTICQFSSRFNSPTTSQRKDKKSLILSRRSFRSPRTSVRSTSSSSSQRICIRNNEASSSEDSESQFYSQPYTTYGSKSDSYQSIITNSDLKRAKASLTLNIVRKKFPRFYCSETESSYKKLTCAKPSRRKKTPKVHCSERKASPPSSSSSWEERISEKGVREVRRKPSRSRTEGHIPRKKASQLSWAPDLLSNLPSSKPKNSDTSTE